MILNESQGHLYFLVAETGFDAAGLDHSWSTQQSWRRDSTLLSLAIHRLAESGVSILSSETEMHF